MLKLDFKPAATALAEVAVRVAEEQLGRGKGEQKKQLAIEFVVNALPVPKVFKPVAKMFLKTLIDEAVELAARRMNATKLEKQIIKAENE